MRFFIAPGLVDCRQRDRKLLVGNVLALLLAVLMLSFAQVATANGPVLKFSDASRVARIHVIIDKSRTLRIDRAFGEALVASSEIADIVPLTDQTIYVVGKRIGMTRITVLDKEKRLLGLIEVEVSFDLPGLRQELDRSIAGGRFRLGTANGRLLLGGSVPDALALAKAVAITEQFTANCAVEELKGIASAGGGQQSLAPQSAPNASNDRSAQRSGPPPKCFVNSLTVRAPQQVLLEVRFVEAQRTAARDLGLSWDAKSNRFRGVTGAILSPVLSGPSAGAALLTGLPSSAIPFGTFIARILDNGATADAVIQALEKRGLARRLAEPNLVALSGDTANFLAGGEFPFPVQADNNRITLEFKKFGVGLAFTPTVLADGQINLKIEPEVSDLDPNNSFLLVNGITVPSLVVRRANTTVELRDGQSFAIAGLIQSKHTKEQRQLPWIGDVPVLGALFRSASYEKEESDLVIIVTPRLVRPVGPGEKLLTPLDQRVASNDRDFFVRGQQEVPKAFPAPYGHILDIDTWATSTKGEQEHAPYK
jgi:pilus assembly protein CpaC